MVSANSISRIEANQNGSSAVSSLSPSSSSGPGYASPGSDSQIRVQLLTGRDAPVGSKSTAWSPIEDAAPLEPRNSRPDRIWVAGIVPAGRDPWVLSLRSCFHEIPDVITSQPDEVLELAFFPMLLAQQSGKTHPPCSRSYRFSRDRSFDLI